MIGSTFGLRLLTKPSVQRSVLWVIAVVVLGFRLAQLVRLMGEIQWGYDFSYYWTAARHLLDGQAIYSPAQLAGPYAPQGQLGFLYPPPLAAAVIPLAGELFGPARSVAAGLRAAGLRTTVSLEQRKLGRELPRVAKGGALVAVLVGPDDWAKGEVAVRDLTTRDQVLVPAGEAAEAAARMVRAHS